MRTDTTTLGSRSDRRFSLRLDSGSIHLQASPAIRFRYRARAILLGAILIGIGFAAAILVRPSEQHSPSDSIVADDGDLGVTPGIPTFSRSEGRPNIAASTEIDSPQGRIDEAKRVMRDCWATYESIRDYSCVFHKRERIDGQLTNPHIMAMKVRTKPSSLYFRFDQPNKGREAIFVPGRNEDKILAHDVGLGKFLAGTMKLDPRGTMAMIENRHPVTDAGLGNLIQTLNQRWDSELNPGESIVRIHPHARVVDMACTMIETIHPYRRPEFLFHQVKVFISSDVGLPIRFEAYEWPSQPGATPPIVEEYTYSNLQTNVGLQDLDFDVKNPNYSFGRF